MSTFDERWRETQREHKRFVRLVLTVWIFWALVSLAVIGVGIWAVIQLVGWLTS